MQDFNQEIILNKDLKTTYKGKELILINVYIYEGPITLQYIPYGGIQSVFNYHLIINTISGYITCDNLIYDNIVMSTKEFVLKYSDLVNQVLPN